MTVLQASLLKAKLTAARNIGHAEERVSIDGVELVFSSLEPEKYIQISESVDPDELSDLEYMVRYQIEHVVRSLVEIDGVDLRDCKYVSTEVEVKGETKTVKVERHEWVRDNVVSTWSREAVGIAFRKFLDAAAEAERRSAEGVTFRVESESEEDKYHRLLKELDDVGSELPDDLREAVLKEHGLARLSSKEELAALNEAGKRFLEEKQEQFGGDAPEDLANDPRVPQQILDAVEKPKEEAGVEEEEPHVQMSRREPMNRTPIAPPVPRDPEAGQSAPAARQRPPRPEGAVHIDQLSRSSRFAELEAEASAEGINILEGSLEGTPTPVVGTTLESPSNVRVEPTTLRLDRPPVVGINPRYVDPRRGGIQPRNRNR